MSSNANAELSRPTFSAARVADFSVLDRPWEAYRGLPSTELPTVATRDAAAAANQAAEIKEADPVHQAAQPFCHVSLHPQAGRDEAACVMLCVTVYNEPLDALVSTLQSVLLAVQLARASGLPGQQPVQKTCIALMLDGPEKTHPDVVAFLRHAGLLAADCAETAAAKATHFYYSRVRTDIGPGPGAASAQAAAQWRQWADSVQFVVCVKDRNRGKLHSHALFFGTLCAQWRPEFCMQIDVGTVIEVHAIEEMLLHFDRMPSAGGLASRVVSHAPQAGAGFLATWQYMDFASQAAVYWPGEIVSGHLSFLPGQFCSLRWDALSATMNRRPFQTEEELQHACSSEVRRAPLDNYLHGIGAQTAVEKVMYLAEDRILGNEIILADAPWRLGFCSSAHTTTDGCEQMGELLRQRRRWNNSSTACKFRILAQWPSYLRRANRSLGAKVRFSFAMLWQIAVIFQQVVAPALFGCLALLVGHGLHSALAQQQWGLPGAIALTAVLAVASTAAAVRVTRARRWLDGLRDAAFACLTGLVIALLCGAMPVFAVAVFFTPMAVATALTCMAFPGTRWVILRRAPEYFLFVNPVMQVCLWIYSILHINDVTWGTKGLTAAGPSPAEPRANAGAAHCGSGAARLSSAAADDSRRATRMRHARNAILAAWLLLNFGLLYIAAHASALYFAGLNPVLEVLCGLFVITLTMAICLHGAKAWRQAALAAAHP